MRHIATIALLLLAGCAPMTPEQAERNNRMWAAMQQSQAQTKANAPAPYMLPTQRVQPYQPQAYQPYQAPTVIAMWTGASRSVQTITNQQGVECTYQYNGQSFNRVFSTPCPSSVEIR